MKRATFEACLKIEARPNSLLIQIVHAPDSQGSRLAKQIRRWTRDKGIVYAEKRFLAIYLPKAEIVPEDERGLTAGMVFKLDGRAYWDKGYETTSFLDTLAFKGQVSISDCTDLMKE